MFSGFALTCTAVHVFGVMADAESFLAFGTDPSHMVGDATHLAISHAYRPMGNTCAFQV